MAQKSREEGEIGSESREKGDLPPCSPPLLINQSKPHRTSGLKFSRKASAAMLHRNYWKI